MTGDEVNEVISQPAAASCIHVPRFEVSEAIHRAQKVVGALDTTSRH
jgi:hypothetical protein